MTSKASHDVRRLLLEVFRSLSERGVAAVRAFEGQREDWWRQQFDSSGEIATNGTVQSDACKRRAHDEAGVIARFVCVYVC